MRQEMSREFRHMDLLGLLLGKMMVGLIVRLQ